MNIQHRIETGWPGTINHAPHIGKATFAKDLCETLKVTLIGQRSRRGKWLEKESDGANWND